MNAPTSLEALAAECDRLAAGTGHVHWPSAYRYCSIRIRALLASRPASDLERRMRDEAARGGDNERCDLLIEAADALAHEKTELERSYEAVARERDCQTLRAERTETLLAHEKRMNEGGKALSEDDERRIAKLESVLIAVEGEVSAWRKKAGGSAMYEDAEDHMWSIQRALGNPRGSSLLTRAEAAEARLTAVTKLLDSQHPMSRVIDVFEVRRALAAPAQTEKL